MSSLAGGFRRCAGEAWWWGERGAGWLLLLLLLRHWLGRRKDEGEGSMLPMTGSRVVVWVLSEKSVPPTR